MFRKTLLKLTLLNAIIFIILMGALGTAIYYYTKDIIYRSDDKLLTKQVNHVDDPIHGPFGVDPDREGKPEIRATGKLYWSENKELIFSPEQLNIDENFAKKLYPNKIGEIEEKEVDGDHFRVYSQQIILNNKLITIESWVGDTQYKFLRILFWIIVIGWAVGSILAVVAGFFLARRALKPIQQAWDKQQAFVSDASHEMRTPLTIIQSRIEMLLKSPRAMIQDKLKDISITLNESRRLSKMVSQLLTLARSDTNQIEIEEKPVHMDVVLKQVYEQFDEMVSYQDKTLTLNVGNTPMTILGDQEKLHQLLVILIDNAIKFTPINGQITMTGSVEGHNVVISVADTGIGISNEDVSKVFDRFFQADTSRTNREGTGLGLSIAKWIVEKHGGKIRVESEWNVGTTFRISFPKMGQRDRLSVPPYTMKKGGNTEEIGGQKKKL